MYIKITTLLLALTSGGLLTSCHKSEASDNSAVSSIEASDSLPTGVKRLVRTIADNDSDGFAKLVSYPLQRPYPLHDIENEDQMRHYYHKLVDDSLRNTVTKSGPAHWSEFGWRGWSLDDGTYVWVDDNVYAVNYVSRHEQRMLDSLRSAEVRSLPESIRNGWQPVLCLRSSSDGTVYRIDSRTAKTDDNSNHYRLAVYNGGTGLDRVPGKLLDGSMQSEGTIGNIIYEFHDAAGTSLYIEPDSPDGGSRLYNSQDSVVMLQRAYWHQLATPANQAAAHK
ncbi:MAG: hypothetical protein K2M87_01455 [Muribaculaceae bacterium]|nr:hypothetical protein [Muribaculaceae bacterium]